MNGKLYINGEWRLGHGDSLVSHNPANNDVIWQGKCAALSDIDAAMQSARRAYAGWSLESLEYRLGFLRMFQSVVESRKEVLAESLAIETGKALWDARSEITAMIAKLGFAHQAYLERTGEKFGEGQGFKTALRHRPHGVVAVYGPYNFPVHLPNGHILPALIAGNCVVFKPSELTPMMGEKMIECWHAAGIPAGVINLVHGQRETGKLLAAHAELDGLFFTGSSDTGTLLHQQFAGVPHKILALELGGNNPLIVHDVADVKAAAYWTVMSAYQTTGQRCTCARRLIVPHGKANDAYIDALVEMTKAVTVGMYKDTPEPFMGPLITNKEADKLLGAQEEFVTNGGHALVGMHRLYKNMPFVSPALIDVTHASTRPDKEWFGPLLQLIRVENMQEAVAEANRTQYGLSCGIFSDNREHYDMYLRHARAGVVNWNRPLTGSSANLPFGGVGLSGNHRPAAYYAADYCAHPVASNEADSIVLPEKPSPGLGL